MTGREISIGAESKGRRVCPREASLEEDSQEESWRPHHSQDELVPEDADKNPTRVALPCG